MRIKLSELTSREKTLVERYNKAYNELLQAISILNSEKLRFESMENGLIGMDSQVENIRGRIEKAKTVLNACDNMVILAKKNKESAEPLTYENRMAESVLNEAYRKFYDASVVVRAVKRELSETLSVRENQMAIRDQQKRIVSSANSMVVKKILIVEDIAKKVEAELHVDLKSKNFRNSMETGRQKIPAFIGLGDVAPITIIEEEEQK